MYCSMFKQYCSPNFLDIGGVTMITCHYPRSVHVSAYLRFRRGRLEWVCEHCRSYPTR